SSISEAEVARAAGADALIAKGHEAGGWVGDETSFVLLQRLIARLGVPIWVQGGIGLHSVAAAYVAGAAGVVLDSQLLLATDAPSSEQLRGRLQAMDGSETICVGAGLGAQFRTYARAGLAPLEALLQLETRLTVGDQTADAVALAWRAAVSRLVDW